MELSNVVIEITRECNLACEHCLRGDAQDLTISPDYIDILFGQVEYISSLTISGGEPSLRPELIYYIKESALKNETEIGNFYLATNAVHVPDRFILSLLELYLYCSDNEITMVEISNDEFHDAISHYGKERLMALKFVKMKHTARNKFGYNSDPEAIIAEGRGVNFGNRLVEPNEIDKTDPEDWQLYLNAKGYIINGCDWSYESQEEQIVCSVSEMRETLEPLIEKAWRELDGV